jgi:hypothetical protein
MRRLSCLLTFALLAACGEQPAPPAAGTPPDSTVLHAFRGVPFMYGAKFMGTSHSGDVAETKLLIDASPDSVADFYRAGLLRRGWQLVNDSRVPDSSIAIYARSTDHRSVWLMIHRNPAGPGTILSVVGAGPGADSTPPH